MPSPEHHGTDERERAAGRRRFGLDTVNSLVQTVAILGAGAWGVYTFIYEARIKPGLEPPAVSVKTALVKAGERGDRVAIRSTVTRTNVGQTAVRVLGLTYNVVGLHARFAEGHEGAAETDLAAREAAFAASLTRSATVSMARNDVRRPEDQAFILRDGILFSGATALPSEPSDLNPGEAVSRDLIVYADRGRFDAVRFEVSLAYEKEDAAPVRLRFETKPDGALRLVPEAPCEPNDCPLKTTEFATEFSLW